MSGGSPQDDTDWLHIIGSGASGGVYACRYFNNGRVGGPNTSFGDDPGKPSALKIFRRDTDYKHELWVLNLIEDTWEQYFPDGDASVPTWARSIVANDEGQMALVMPRYGSTAYDLYNADKLTLVEATAAAYDLYCALDYLHKMLGVVHGDVRAPNIVTRYSGDPLTQHVRPPCALGTVTRFALIDMGAVQKVGDFQRLPDINGSAAFSSAAALLGMPVTPENDALATLMCLLFMASEHGHRLWCESDMTSYVNKYTLAMLRHALIFHVYIQGCIWPWMAHSLASPARQQNARYIGRRVARLCASCNVPTALWPLLCDLATCLATPFTSHERPRDVAAAAMAAATSPTLDDDDAMDCTPDPPDITVAPDECPALVALGNHLLHTTATTGVGPGVGDPQMAAVLAIHRGDVDGLRLLCAQYGAAAMDPYGLFFYCVLLLQEGCAAVIQPYLPPPATPLPLGSKFGLARLAVILLSRPDEGADARMLLEKYSDRTTRSFLIEDDQQERLWYDFFHA